MDTKSVDIMVLGATGYTGKFVVKLLADLSMVNGFDIIWGVSGRSKQKIQGLLADLNKSGLNTNNIPVVECDITNLNTVRNLTQMSRILINCTGPHTLLSAPVVKTCIETNTHYLDISAELFHILNLYCNYNKVAEEANVLVIPTCGFCAIPIETGLIHLQKNFKGTLNTVECYGELSIPKRAYFPGRCLIHYGTWESLVYVLKNFKECLELKRQIFPDPIEAVPEEMNKSFFHRHEGKCWFPYPGTENDVAEISQRYLFMRKQKNPLHFKAYTTVPIFIHYIIVPVFFFYYYMCYFGCFRRLLKNYPRFFSLGYMSHKGPSESMRNKTKFTFTLIGKGWEIGSDLKSKPTKSLTVKVTCKDPGYQTTAVSIVSAAITVLKESSKMPNGGVIMPGAAFYDTEIVNRLINGGISYKVIE